MRTESSYDTDLARGLALSGESKEYFAEGRLCRVRERLEPLEWKVGSVLDFGCGPGSTTPLFHELLGAELVVGVDPSAQLLARAKEKFGSASAEFLAPEDLAAEPRFDLGFCNGVFHHIPPERRVEAARYIFVRLRPGAPFAFCENNPWNPGTRWVMRRIPFDRDSIPIALPEARRLLREVGFEILASDALFFFPRILRWLRPLERPLVALPLGAQYLVLARKPGA